jgi:protein-disulfide isomerase
MRLRRPRSDRHDQSRREGARDSGYNPALEQAGGSDIMDVRLSCLLLALAACASAPAKSAVAPPPAAAAEPAPPSPAGPLPGVSLEGLTPEEQAVVVAFANEQFCYCGCPHTLIACLREHASCRHARRMVAFAVRLVRAGAHRSRPAPVTAQAAIGEIVRSYYSSFDRRARLDVVSFGPPLGNPDAPVTMVEFSDFTCPYCMMVRPALESFVRARADRVKLFYKPFPIDSHPGAYAAAQAAEWARARGSFWAMHDALFANPEARTADEIAALASHAGGDPAELRAALAGEQFLPRVKESQAEARQAGIRGTPTLFLDGRRLDLSDFSEEGLELTLQDEEEWQRHGGWERD